MEKDSNKGLILDVVLGGKDWQLGGVNNLDSYRNETGQWDFPVAEKQSNSKFDSYACVSFSQNNIIEGYVKQRYNVDINFDDQFLAAITNTKCGFGNYMGVVAEGWRNFGALLERGLLPTLNTCEEYVKKPSAEEIARAGEVLNEWDFKWAWGYDTTAITDQEETMRAMIISPVAVAVNIDYTKYKDGIFYKTDKKANHDVTIFKYKEGEYFEVLDNYDWSIKKLSWDYKFHAKLVSQLIKKSNNIPMIDSIKELERANLHKGTFLVQQTGEGGSGEFGVLIDSKLYIDSLDKLTATFLVRNGKVGSGLTKDIWNGLKQFNLKNESLN